MRVLVLLLAAWSFVLVSGPYARQLGTPTPGPPARDNTSRSQAQTASISGRVVAAGRNTPLRRAQIYLSAADTLEFVRASTTDGDGRYEIGQLPAGRYQLTVDKPGYVTLQHGQRRPFERGLPISLRDGERKTRVDVALSKGSVISVRLADEFGEPVANASVYVQRFQWGNDGQRRLNAVPVGSHIGNRTDDRGEVRLFGLMPGEYVVEARAASLGATPGDTSETVARTFYPGTLSVAEARPVTVGVDQQLTLQLTMMSARLARISGSVSDSQGRPGAGAGISLFALSGSVPNESGVGRVAPDGTFAISGVAPGEYSLRFNMRTEAGWESTALPIMASGDMSGVSAILTPGTTITGRIIYDAPPPPAGAGWPALARVAATDPWRDRHLLDNATGGDADFDGNFQIHNAAGRVFFGVPDLPPEWVVRSVLVDGLDVTDEGVDLTGRRSISDVRVTVTNKLTRVGGYVTAPSGQRLTNYVVVIQPAEPKDPAAAARIVRAVRPDANGRFETRGLRAGRYLATAIESIEQNRQYSPEFQNELRRAGREFTLGDAQTVDIELRVVEGL